MCLAVAPNKQSSNGVFSRIWRSVSATPLRLFTMCALAHALILGGLFIATLILLFIAPAQGRIISL